MLFHWILLLTLSAGLSAAPAAPPNPSNDLTKYFTAALAAYKRLEHLVPRKELQQLTTIGILHGAQQVESDMEQHLIAIVKDLLLNTNMNQTASVLPKIDNIEQQLQRDECALKALAATMELAMQKTPLKLYKKGMHQLQRDCKRPANAAASNESMEQHQLLAERIGKLRLHILQQMDMMHTMLDEKIQETLAYVVRHADAHSLVGKASHKSKQKRQTAKLDPAVVRQIKSILTEDDFHKNLIDAEETDKAIQTQANEPEFFSLDAAKTQRTKQIFQRSSGESMKLGSSKESAKTSAELGEGQVSSAAKNGTGTAAKQQEDSDELEITANGNDDGGGGLTGLIAGLSGGEGGSDIGALIGALTGVISNLFGPGGLDISSLISTATSLISGLLAGNKNFGTVLGEYVGTAFDGLSGGGGAINNGQFIGNFLGTVVASLSADPEEDNVPPKPFIFLQNFLNSFIEAKNRQDVEEISAEELNSLADSSSRKKNEHTAAATDGGGGGSDSGAFIKQIAAHIAGTAVSIILNAVVGASGGSSQASSTLFSSSSAGHKPAAGG